MGFGETTARAFADGAIIDPAQATFEPAQPGEQTDSVDATSVGDQGGAHGLLSFDLVPADLSGIRVNFKVSSPTSVTPVLGKPLDGAKYGFGPPDIPFIATGTPTIFSYNNVELAADDYILVATNEDNTVISEPKNVTVNPFAEESSTAMPLLEIKLPPDDDDVDGLPNQWEIDNELDPNSAAFPNGGPHDKEPDGLTNIEEYREEMHPQQSHPNRIDTDGDGHPDGFERYAGSNPAVSDEPPLLNEVFVRHNFTEIIQVGTLTRPVTSISDALGRVDNPGTITIQNAGPTPIAEPGPFTIGAGGKAVTIRLADPNGPSVRLGATN